MNEYTITKFCEKHGACTDGREWALANCQTMQDVWDKAKPEWLIWTAMCTGVLTDKELRLFAVWCAKQVQHLRTDQRSIDVSAVAERHANGQATGKELDAARDAARVAGAAARDAASAAAWAAARDAAWAAASAAAWAAAKAATWAAARDKQAAYLRENCKPNFEKKLI